MDLQRLYCQKADEGYTRTVRYIHTTMLKALHQAEAWDPVRKNVARFAKVPKTTGSEEEREPMSLEEVKTFLKAIKGHKHEALYSWPSPPACATESSSASTVRRSRPRTANVPPT